jgi:hypothetical protein
MVGLDSGVRSARNFGRELSQHKFLPLNLPYNLVDPMAADDMLGSSDSSWISSIPGRHLET